MVTYHQWLPPSKLEWWWSLTRVKSARRGFSVDSYHGDQVSEPLVGQLVSDHQSHPLVRGGAGVLGVNEQCRLPWKGRGTQHEHPNSQHNRQMLQP